MRWGDYAAHAAAFWAAVLFGASVVATWIVVQQIPPLTLALLRFGQGGLILVLALLVAAPGLLRVRLRDLPFLFALGAILFAVFPVTFNAGLRLTTASRGLLMLASMPLWTAVLARAVGSERLGLRPLLGVLLSIVGVGLVLHGRGLSWDETTQTMKGDGLMLLAAACGALYSVLAPRALGRYPAVTVTAYAMVLGTLLVLPASLAAGLSSGLADVDDTAIIIVVFLGVLGGALGYLLWTFALARLSPTQVTVYVNLNPIVATAAVLMRERLTLAFGAGLLAVVGGVLLVNWPGCGAASHLDQGIVNGRVQREGGAQSGEREDPRDRPGLGRHDS
jgi:drug/metabolite transporter (DMT)-like permease